MTPGSADYAAVFFWGGGGLFCFFHVDIFEIISVVFYTFIIKILWSIFFLYLNIIF